MKVQTTQGKDNENNTVVTPDYSVVRVDIDQMSDREELKLNRALKSRPETKHWAGYSMARVMDRAHAQDVCLRYINVAGGTAESMKVVHSHLASLGFSVQIVNGPLYRSRALMANGRTAFTHMPISASWCGAAIGRLFSEAARRSALAGLAELDHQKGFSTHSGRRSGCKIAHLLRPISVASEMAIDVHFKWSSGSREAKRAMRAHYAGNSPRSERTKVTVEF